MYLFSANKNIQVSIIIIIIIIIIYQKGFYIKKRYIFPVKWQEKFLYFLRDKELLLFRAAFSNLCFALTI